MLDAVAVFVKVVEAGSFSVAAKRLDMPKTTVSAKMAALEKRLGVRLIQRTTRKLHLTEAGEAYFRHCSNAVREVELGEAALQSAKGKPSGLLRVTAPADMGHSVLPRIVQAYVTKFSEVSVDLTLTNRVVDLVGEGIDVAIRFGRTLQDSSLVARRFTEVKADLWSSPKYMKRLGEPTHPRELANAAFVTHPFQKGSLLLTNGKSDFELSMKGRVRADDVELITTMITLGEGIAWLPDFLSRDAAKAGKLVRVLPHWHPKHQPGTCYFVYPSRHYALPKVESFIQTALLHVRPDQS
ncbi:LysR substrate-binding domain-containing protein [Bradyrhizobium sp. DASA03068]|uniref:LysR family transcriptional regulator n=1 Tax=Bradyrhizobium sp. BLXBL-01 TaxID=3395915 RepID=UPI003F7255B3